MTANKLVHSLGIDMAGIWRSASLRHRSSSSRVKSLLPQNVADGCDSSAEKSATSGNFLRRPSLSLWPVDYAASHGSHNAAHNSCCCSLQLHYVSHGRSQPVKNDRYQLVRVAEPQQASWFHFITCLRRGPDVLQVGGRLSRCQVLSFFISRHSERFRFIARVNLASHYAS